MLEKLRDSFSGVVQKISGNSTITENNIQDAVDTLRNALLEADVNVRVVRRFINQTMEAALGTQVLKSVAPGQMFIKLLNEKLCQFLGDTQSEIVLKGNPAVILMCGLQGSGKTTTSAKLAQWYQAQGKQVMLVAADTTRPAAIEQLQTLANQIQCKMFTVDNKSPKELVSLAVKESKQSSVDVLIVDTAGRTEIDENLLDELTVLSKHTQSCARLLVLDSMTGQTAVTVATKFNEAIDISGLILTKADSDARGGALLSVKTMVNVPVHFLGTSEHMDGLEVFHPDRMASRILGMGDVVSLVEKVQEQVDEKEAEKLQKKILKKTFTLQDYLNQFSAMKNIGSIEQVAEMMPGVNQEQINQIDVKQIKREESIILSMTTQERENAKLIGPSRRTRIAKGSGVSVAQVNALLKKFEKTKKLMKKTMKNKKYLENFTKEDMW